MVFLSATKTAAFNFKNPYKGKGFPTASERLLDPRDSW